MEESRAVTPVGGGSSPPHPAITFKYHVMEATGAMTNAYIYAAVLIHKTGQEVTQERMAKVLTAAGAIVDGYQVRFLVDSLKDIDIDKASAEGVKFFVKKTIEAPAPQATKPKEPEPEKKDESVTGLEFLFGDVPKKA